MRSSLFSWACLAVLGLSFLAGCAESPPASGSLARKPVAVQMPMPSHAAPSAPTPSPLPAPVQPFRVAILLPLTGPQADLGHAMLNAAQQAVFDAAGEGFELQPQDTAATGGAGAAAATALDSGARLLIGPLFAADVSEVAPLAQQAHLPILPLSSDVSLARPGVYVMGHDPAAQVDRVVSYAAQHGSNGFAALIPETPYGDLVAKALQTSVARQGKNLIGIERVAPDGKNLDAAVKKIAAQRKGIDALFLPESGEALKKTVARLAAAGIDSAHLHALGTGVWDDANGIALLPLLKGAWYAAPDPALRMRFSAAYKEAYGGEPPRLATLAYDATALAAAMAKHGHVDGEAGLANPNGFAGLDGIFRLKQTGEVERGLAVIEWGEAGRYVVDPAPKSFGSGL